jgi:hypothetical protein
MNGRQTVLLILTLAAAAALIAIGLKWPHYAGGGWLTSFVYVSAIPLGSLQLLFIYRLTGGRWGEVLGPFFELVAACIPLLAILFVPVLIALPTLFPWVNNAGAISELKLDVAAYYLNTSEFIARTTFAFVVWSALALVLPHVSGRAGTLLAALGMIFHAVIMSLLSIDWILSSEPTFISTSFGASIAVMQILAALSFAAFVAPVHDSRAVRDLGALMLAVVLGLTYIDFMAVLVLWYGNIPAKVDWLLQRTFSPWKWLAIGAFIFGSLLPILALLFERVRTSRTALSYVGGSFLIGLALYGAYLVTPSYDVWSIATAVLAVVALGGALILFVNLGWSDILLQRSRRAEETAHE